LSVVQDEWEQIRQRWDLDEAAPTLVAAGANRVFRSRRRDEVVYVRITSPSHRSTAQVVAEMRWMEALAQAGCRVAAPLRSHQGALVEPIQREAALHPVVCVSGAPGRPAKKPEDDRTPVIESWASLLADLHHHARHWPKAERPIWRDDPVFQMAWQATDPEVAKARHALTELVTWLDSLPHDDSFGLTHADLHLGNLAVAEGDVVTAFDFDDACYHWFAHDLGVAITSIRKAAWEHPGVFDAAALERQFLDRYFEEGPLAPSWRDSVDAFVRYRVALSACWARRALETGQLDDSMVTWYRRSLPWWLKQLG
jgi:Ser/Thr protein kinase RdoA (MazF antagonist)